MSDILTAGVISASDNPHVANDIINKAMVGDYPLMQAPPDGEVQLTGGFVDPKGDLQMTALVRELTGADEEALAIINPNNKLAEYLTTIVSRACLSVGNTPMSRDVATALLSGDREMLVLAIRQITFGDELRMTMGCPACGNRSEITIFLNEDIDIKRDEAPLTRLHPMQLKDGSTVDVIFPTGYVQERVEKVGNTTLASLNTVLLSYCVIRDGKLLREEEARNLALADRRKILNFINENQPGPRFGSVKAPCASCGREYPINVGIEDLFRG